MANLIKTITDALLKAIPFSQRTRWIAVGQLIYAVSGVISGSLSHEAAAVVISTAIGLLTARQAADK